MNLTKKLNELEKLVQVPNVNHNPIESLRGMKMLNLIVDIRAGIAALQPINAHECVKSSVVGQSEQLPCGLVGCDKIAVNGTSACEDHQKFCE